MTGFCCGTTSIFQKAQNEIILIDGYVDVDTLNILAKKNSGVDVKITLKQLLPGSQKSADYPYQTFIRTFLA